MLRVLLLVSPVLLVLWGKRRKDRKRANDASLAAITTAAEEAEIRGAEAAAAEASRQR